MGRFLVVWMVVAALGILLLAEFAPKSTSSQPQSISYATFLRDVEHNQVTSIQASVESGVITGEFTDKKTFTAQGPPGGMPGSDLAVLDAHHVARNYSPPPSAFWGDLLLFLVPMGLIVLLWVWIAGRSRGQMAGIMGWSKSKANVHTTEKPSTTFADIAGYEAVKEEIREVVEFLTDAQRFEDIGARVPKGLLLVGPPGTGKTLLARAVAGEAGVAFITINGSEFMEMFVGVGAARVRDLFEKARQQKPCIIFIDEIDAIGRKRGTGIGGGHDEREQTLNQILSEMDGFDGVEGIVILAATNRPDVLDPALLRAGRFDRQIVVPLPTKDERLAVLQVHCRGKRIGPDVDLETVARGTPGMSGADLENLLNESALIAVRYGRTEIGSADIEAARERILLGLRRTSLALNDEERRMVAYHEAGHAVLAQLLEHADPVHRVTILPTGMALGATQQLPSEDRSLQTRAELEDIVCVRLGGRAAEELIFGMPSTGAQDDLAGATELSRRMVREWGMSKELGNMSWAPNGPVFLGEDLVQTRDYSDETAHLIDEEVSRLLAEQTTRAVQTLTTHRGALEAVAEELQSKETLEGSEVDQLIEGAEAKRTATVTPTRAVAGERARPHRRTARHVTRAPAPSGPPAVGPEAGEAVTSAPPDDGRSSTGS